MMTGPTVFIISESAPVGDSVRELVESAGLEAENFASLQTFLGAVDEGCAGCLVFNARGADLMDQENLAVLAEACARMPAMLLTERGDVPGAVRAIKAGAMSVVEKPYRDGHLLDSIQQALQPDGSVAD